MVAPAPGYFAPDFVVQLQDVLDGGVVGDAAAGHVVLGGPQVVRALGAKTLGSNKKEHARNRPKYCKGRGTL